MKKYEKKLIIGLALFLLITPIFCLAVEIGGASNLGSDSQSGSIPNPLGAKMTDPRVVIGIVINTVLGIVGSLALAVFILGGLIWMTSGGNQEKVTKGKNMIVWAVMGLVVIFFSYAVLKFVFTALQQ